jgi:cyanate permease
VESHQPVTFPSCGSIKVFLETITIFVGFDSFVDDGVVGWISNILVSHLFIPEKEQGQIVP